MGTITDDQGNPLPNVTVSLYRRNFVIGRDPSDAETVTNENGQWETTVSIDLDRNYTIYISRTGFMDLELRAAVSYIGPDTVDTGTISLPPIHFDDVYRIVLTWGPSPSDLDAHLTGPGGDNSRFHVYWNNRTAASVEGDTIAHLINDKRGGFGPETIALRKLLPGTYRFSVHNYNANQVSGDTLLAVASNATVRVFSENGLQKEFKISGEHAPDQKVGNTWRVFEINGETGEITFVNELFDGVRFDDSTIFRIETKPERRVPSW